jgi:ParB family chromosome partitioning protein
MAKRKGFFDHISRPEDDLARRRDIEALLVPRRLVVQDISVERIHPNPFQARQVFDGLDELAESIRVQGFVSRLRIRPDPDHTGFFQLVYGERRLRAARLAGLTEIPCEITEHTDDELIEIGLAENIQRRDLAPLEEAQAFQQLIERRGYTVRSLAQRIGKDKGYIDSRLALLRVPADVQRLITQRPDTIRAAREIARLEDVADRKLLIDGLIQGQITTADVRQQVSRTLRPPESTTIEQQLDHDLQTINAIFSRWIGEASNPDHHAPLIRYVEQLLANVETLTESLQT